MGTAEQQHRRRERCLNFCTRAQVERRGYMDENNIENAGPNCKLPRSPVLWSPPQIPYSFYSLQNWRSRTESWLLDSRWMGYYWWRIAREGEGAGGVGREQWRFGHFPIRVGGYTPWAIETIFNSIEIRRIVHIHCIHIVLGFFFVVRSGHSILCNSWCYASRLTLWDYSPIFLG